MKLLIGLIASILGFLGWQTLKPNDRKAQNENAYKSGAISYSPTPCREMWNSSMPCFSPDGERIAWSADNWTGTGWLGDYSTRPYDDAIPTENIYDSYWKPLGLEQGSSHNIWIMDKDEDHHYWFPASYWGWDNGLTIYKHHHHKNYNPSWDEQP